MTRRLAAPLVSTLLLAALIGDARGAGAATVDVTVGNAFFSPQVVNVQVGDTVRWTNNTTSFHSVTDDHNDFEKPAASGPWTFTHTFSTPGSVGYHCSVHGFVGGGMSGTVVVGGAASQPGTLRFSQWTFSTNEDAGTATITVQRISGDDGAVSVDYTASSATATAGADFTAPPGTLSWADNDDTSKSFTVTVVNDALVEGLEFVQLALSGATGGAAIDPTGEAARLQIVDDDGPPGNPPAAPTNLQAVALSTTSAALAWIDNADNENGFRIERRTLEGAFAEVTTVGADVSGVTLTGLTPATFYLFRVRAVNNGGFSGYSNEASATTEDVVAACVAGAETLCLNNGRFRTEIAWRTASASGRGQALPIASAPDSGLFYFFSPSNLEMLIKVLDACVAPFYHYWVFYSATTNVEFAVTITDTETGKTKSYFNPLNRPAPPVQDVDAFFSCP